MIRTACQALGLGILLVAPAFGAHGTAPAPAPAPAAEYQAERAKTGEIRTLTDLLERVAWETGVRGPLLVVDPAGTARVGLPESRSRVAPDSRPVSAALPPPGPDGKRNLKSSLAAFDRVLMPVGSLSVVAPQTMVLIGETFPKRPPNLWDGMRPDEKLLFILSTLSPGQWAILGGTEGIGVSDLSGDARAAYLSLLPARFAYREGTVDKDGFLPDAKPVVLSASERREVRLRMSLSPTFQVPTGERSYTQTSPSFRGMPGDRAAERDNDGEYDRPESYGITMQSRVPNRAKPSDLAYDSPELARSLPLAGAKTMGDLVARAGERTGLDLHADFRVAGLPVTSRGASARAGDVLKALALAVCGTWRRVGDAESKTYVLAADRTGAGARRLRLAEWQADLEARKERQVTAWRAAVAKGGSFGRVIGYAPDDPLAPKGALTDRFAASEKGGRSGGALKPENLIGKAELTPAMQEHLRQFASMYKHQVEKEGWNLDRVQVEESVVARFVLPNGTTLGGDANLNLGSSQFLDTPPFDSVDYDARDKASLATYLKTVPLASELPTVNADKLGASLFLAAASPDEGVSAVALARRYGFTDLFLGTDDPATAAAAVKAAAGSPLKVSVVAPLLVGSFAQGVPAAEQDRNLLGETGAEAAGARMASARWPEYAANRRRQTFPRPTGAQVAGLPGTSLVPGSLLGETRGRQIAAIAATPGLAGVVLTGTAPVGYAGARSEGWSGGGGDFALSLRAELGYAAPLRRAFIGKEGVDPIDLIPRNLRFAADLRQPFFLDDNARGDSTVYDGRDRPAAGFEEKNAAWNAFRGRLLVAALQGLRETLSKARPNLPVWIAPLPSILPNGNFRGPGSYVLWPGATPLPPRTDSHGDYARSDARNPVLMPYRMPRPETELDVTFSRLMVQSSLGPPPPAPPNARPAPMGPRPAFSLDLSDMPLAEADALLAKLVRPVGEGR